MAESQSNAPLRASAGPPTSGVIHIRTRLTADFAVISNALAQRRGSAVTVGVAAYILSLPDGARVSIEALCEHFTEGEILISRALRELETAGYLERRRERGPGGMLHTRTYFYDVPRGTEPEPPVPPVPPSPPRPRRSGRSPREAVPEPQPEADLAPEATPEAGSSPEPDPRALVILASLRIVDRRLILSRREVDQLAPAVTQWLAQGVDPQEITGHLTARLPDPLLARPARILAYRLRELPLPLPAFPTQAATPAAVLPWQTCDGGCERAFRAAEPGRCRDCPPEDRSTAGAAVPHDDDWATAC
jgi:hypothetical protein